MNFRKIVSSVVSVLVGYSSMFAALPECTPQNVEKYKKICRENIHKVKKGMYREPKGSLRHKFITPGCDAYLDNLWDWDSWLSGIALCQIMLETGNKADFNECMEYQKGCIYNALDYCGLEGYIPIIIAPNSPSREEMISQINVYDSNMHKPCLAQQAAFITKLTGDDAEWIRDNINKLATFVNKYMTYHRDKATGLLYWNDDFMIGVDNDPSTFYRPRNSSASIYLNTLMYKELLAMKYLSECLDMPSNAAAYGRDASELRDSIIKHCWDERDSFFYSCDLNLLPVEKFSDSGFHLHQSAPRDYDCVLQRFSVWSGFLPMWAGLATPEQARGMVERNYLDERLFNAPGGVYTLAPTEKMYNIKPTQNPSSWLGPVWTCANWFVWRGLVNYGYEKEARELAEKTVLMLGRDFERFGELHEYYEPVTGEPIMNKGFQNWNLLVLNMIAWLDGRDEVREF